MGPTHERVERELVEVFLSKYGHLYTNMVWLWTHAARRRRRWQESDRRIIVMSNFKIDELQWCTSAANRKRLNCKVVNLDFV